MGNSAPDCRGDVGRPCVLAGAWNGGTGNDRAPCRPPCLTWTDRKNTLRGEHLEDFDRVFIRLSYAVLDVLLPLINVLLPLSERVEPENHFVFVDLLLDRLFSDSHSTVKACRAHLT